MADSDCSNCDKDNCEYRDYSYDCYANKIKEVRQCMDDFDIQEMIKVRDRAQVLYHQTYMDEFINIEEFIQKIIDMYNKE